VAGLALLSPAVALMLYGLAQVSGDGGFAHRAVLIPLAAGAVLLAGFIGWALRPRHGVRPLIDLRLLRVRSFSAAAGLMFISGLSMYGALFLLPLYYQQVRGASALGAGLLLAPQGIGALLARTLAGKLTDRIGPRPVVLAGMAIAAAGTVPFALAGAHTSELLLSLVLVVRGAGLTTANIALMAGAFTGLPRESVPDASSVTRIMQQVGGSFGDRRARGDPGGPFLPGDVLVVGGVHRPGGAACGYAAGPPRQPGGRSGERVTVSRRGDGTATGQQASAQTVRPG
jgi:predicted MFS family arabinose efflux permease